MDRRNSLKSLSIHPANTTLLLQVEVPATGFNVLLNFEVKPGSLQQVQQGITEVIDELADRLASSLKDKDLQSNADKYEVAKLECEQQLQEWQSKLSEATLAVLRADRSRNELAKMREAYFREVQNLRQQLHQKQQAEEQGDSFIPDSVDLYHTNKEDREADLLEQLDRMEEQHKEEIEAWKQKNAALVDKLRSKAMQVNLQSELVAKVLDDQAAVPEENEESNPVTFCDAEVQTVMPKLKDASCATESVSRSCASIQTVGVKGPEQQEMEVQTDFEDPKPKKPSKGRSSSPKAPSKQKARTKSTELTAKDLFPDALEVHLPPDLPSGVDQAAQTEVDTPGLGFRSTATVATQVDPTQLGMTPLSPRTPRTQRPRPRQRAETVEDVDLVSLQSMDSREDSDSGISNCLMQTWPSDRPVTPPSPRTRLPNLEGTGANGQGSKSLVKKTALTIPTSEEIAGKEVLLAVSSMGHSAVMTSHSDGARPSKRTINRPRLSSPSQFSTG